MVAATGEEMRDRDENDGAESCRGERIPEAATEDSELHEDPAAKKRADQSEDNVGDATEAAATCDLSREPAGDKTNQQPANHSVPELNDKELRIHRKRRKESKHFASGRSKVSTIPFFTFMRERFLCSIGALAQANSQRGLSNRCARSGIAPSLGARLLLGHAVERAQAEHEIAAGNAHHFAFRK